MNKYIIIVDNNIQNIKSIINSIMNRIENQNIKSFVATDKLEIQEIEQSNDISLILINKKLNFIYNSENNSSILYYRR